MGVSTIEVKVRGYHVDLYGHVNNARYLEFIEEARWAFAEDSLDLAQWQERGIGFSIVNITINYRHPAFMGDMLEIHTHLAELGNASGTIHHEIMLKGKNDTVVDADVTFVMVNTQTNKAVPMKGEIRKMFEKLATSN